MHAAVLRYIDQVAHYGSIRRAASALNVASSAVNRQILKLEYELGVPLFERIGNGVRPTAAGKCLIRHARETMNNMEDVKAEIASFAGNLHGEVRILTFPAPLVRLLPRAIERTVQMHPNITFQVIDATPAEHTKEMRENRPDIAVLFVDRRRKSYDIVGSMPLRLGTIMRPDHPLAILDQVTLTECAAYPVIMLSNPWLLSATAETEFSQSGARFHATMMTNSLSITKQMLKAGIGISFFTLVGFADEISRGELAFVPLSEPNLSAVELGLMVNCNRQNLPAVQAIQSVLMEEFAALKTDIDELDPCRAKEMSSKS